MPKSFKPIMISFDEEAYNLRLEKAQKKIDYLNYAKDWIHDALDKKVNVNMKALSKNMLLHFEDLILEFYKDVNQLGLSANKLIEAKEIDLSKLMEAQTEFNKIDYPITFADSKTPIIDIKRKDFETWTTTESQNKKVVIANEIIASINKLKKSELAKIYPGDIVRGTSGFLRYDMRKNKFIIPKDSIL